MASGTDDVDVERRGVSRLKRNSRGRDRVTERQPERRRQRRERERHRQQISTPD